MRYAPSTLLLLVAVLLAACSSSTTDVRREGLPERPNIVLVLADDMGFGDARCYDASSRIPTPNVDRLAREGVRLTDAHSPSAVCSPTRYGLLTGRYAWRTSLQRGVLWGDSPSLIEAGRPTVASVLRSAGYRTGAFGKWHLGLGSDPRGPDYTEPIDLGPVQLGFETFFGISATLDMWPYAYLADDRLESPLDSYTPGSNLRRVGGEGFWRPGPMSSGFRHEEVLPRTVDRAIATMERFHEETPDRPFFVYLALTAPHTPWVPTKEYQGRSAAGWYGDFVAQVDGELGRVMDALQRLGVADDTLLVFTSDNGAHWEESDIAATGHRSNASWRGQKADAWEGGHRVPFVARWPGHVEAGKARDGLLVLTDLFATFASIGGAEVPEGAGEDALDQTDLLVGAEPATPIRTTAVLHSFEGMFVMRSDRWKLIEGLGSGGSTFPAWRDPEPGEPPGQLYDLERDRARARTSGTCTSTSSRSCAPSSRANAGADQSATSTSASARRSASIVSDACVMAARCPRPGRFVAEVVQRSTASRSPCTRTTRPV
ncbi:MAG: arylsulfatase [Planctomycetota bacterium]